MKTKVFESVFGTREVEVSSLDEEIRLTVITKLGGVRTGVSLPNATGTELALAVLEAMDMPEGSAEGVAAMYLRDELAERQREAKLEALALELYNATREAMNCDPIDGMGSMGENMETMMRAMAAKALELGASVDN